MTVDEAIKAGASLLNGGQHNGTYYTPINSENLLDTCTLVHEVFSNGVAGTCAIAISSDVVEVGTLSGQSQDESIPC